ncbi:MAG: hypothetical protein ACE5FJ_04235 [Gemmatimonadales bacterium]
MERVEPDQTFHGVVGGVLAGGVVAVWFFVVDLAAGEPFQTPARLASTILGEEFAGAWPRLIVVYSILHLGVFASLGAAGARTLKWMGIDPGLLVGAVFGVGVLNAVHYGGILVTGTNLLTVVPAVHVTAANVLGGMVMMGYLHRALRADSPLGWNVFRSNPTVFNGTVAGLAGAATVALWLFVVDVARGVPFYTPAVLGSAILLGAAETSEVQVNLGVIAAYTMLHVLAFAFVGIAFTWMAGRVRRASQIWIQGVVLILILEGMFFGTIAMLSGWVVDDIGWGVLGTANVLAIASIGYALTRLAPAVETG